MAFKERTTAPAANDPNYISVNYGGFSHALAINKTTGCTLANCCGLVHGRVLENAGADVEARICRGNAGTYYDYSGDGLKRSKTTPALGAIMVWKSKATVAGGNNYGHVCIVEEIAANGDVLTSNSNYSGTWFYTARFSKSSGYKLTSSKAVYTFQGFIYMPEDIKKVGEPVPRDTSVHQIEVVYAALRARKRPELGAEIVGYANMGYYDVLGIKDMTAEPSNGFKWFKIGTGLWVANVDGCVNDYPPEDHDGDPDEIQKLKKENAELKTEILSLELTVDKLRATIDDIQALAHYN